MPHSASLPVVLCVVLAAGSFTPASAGDQPISGAKLYIKSQGGGQQLTFTSKDPAVLFAVAGSTDDPASGVPGGALVEILSVVEATASFTVPPGIGKPGWDSHAAMTRRHLFTNSLAPNGISPVKKLILKQGKTLQLIAKAPGLALTTATTQVAIRITTGALRSCAVFDAASIRKSEPGKLIAIKAPQPAIPDCSDASLLSIPSACGLSAPTCNGDCPPGEECASFGFASPFNDCGCLPTGATPCGTPSAPTCGGACPNGGPCGAVYPPLAVGGGVTCGCGYACGNGFAYGGDPSEFVPFGCYPLLCSGTYPTCGGPCLDGGTCMPFEAGAGAFTGCICSVPAGCGAGGHTCPVGEVCHLNGPTTACGPP